jgi:uncharacterized surface anchored protein
MKIVNFVWWLSWSGLLVASPLEERAVSSSVCNNAQVKALRSSNANCYCSSYLRIPVSTVTKLTTTTSTIRTTTTKKIISTKSVLTLRRLDVSNTRQVIDYQSHIHSNNVDCSIKSKARIHHPDRNHNCYTWSNTQRSIYAQTRGSGSSNRTGQESHCLDMRDASSIQEHEQSGYIERL